jgi:carbohydrate-selective porin (OprB family)
MNLRLSSRGLDEYLAWLQVRRQGLIPAGKVASPRIGFWTHVRAEHIGEVYYNWQISKHFHLTPDYQLAVDPAYNHARGPINLFALRFHTEF